MNIYLPNGYIDIEKILQPKGFNKFFFVGPRGSGKSFGVLDYEYKRCLNGAGKFFYVRTNQVELDLLRDPELSPFVALNIKNHYDITLKKKNQYLVSIYEDSEKMDNPIGSCLALSTVFHVRGMSANLYQDIFYDEFIPEQHVRKMKGQGKAVKQMYETFNRNRELEGEPAMRLICCANSDDLNNDLLMSYDLVDHLLQMRAEDIEVKDFPDRGLRLIYPLHSPIAEKKKNTAAYKGESGSYVNMALGNEFVSFYKGNIQPRDIKQFNPVVKIGSLCIYKSKTNKEIYITRYQRGEFKEIYDLTDYNLSRFRLRHHKLQQHYYNKKIKFESSSCELEFVNLWDKQK